MRLTVIIPAYNEEQAIRAGKLAQARAWLDRQPFGGELIVVDDESTDLTASLAAAFADRVLTIPHAGKAAAITAGIRAAGGDVVLFSDMDQATPIEEAARLLAEIDAGAGVAVGSRGIVRRGAPPGRYLLSWGQAAMKFLLLGMRITDTQCGFKAFRRTAALHMLDALVVYSPERQGRVKGPSVTSGFDVELLFVAARLGYAIREVPVAWNYQHTRRVNLVRDALRGLRDLARIALARLAGQYRIPRAR